MVWWRARIASGKEMTVLCVNQMNWRQETLLLALPQGGRGKDSIGIRNWLWAVWEGRSAARLICPSWLLAMGKPDCSGPQRSQHSVRSCDGSKQGGGAAVGQAELWMFCHPKRGGCKPVVDNDHSVLCCAERGGICPGLKMQKNSCWSKCSVGRRPPGYHACRRQHRKVWSQEPGTSVNAGFV